jgi:hypothetical protein
MAKRMGQILALVGILGVALGCLSRAPAEVSAARVDPLAHTVPPTPTSAHAPERAYWAARGIVFEGPWQEHEIDLVTEVLARFADRLGEARFLALIRQAVRAGTDGQQQTLTLRRDVDVDGMVGSWAFDRGRITIYDGLFDPEHLAANHALRFEQHLAYAPDGPILPPMFTIAHELGHVLVEGLRWERRAQGLSPTGLEDLYAERIAPDVRAHPFHSVKENLASEIGLWVFEVHRPPAMRAFHERMLGPALLRK